MPNFRGVLEPLKRAIQQRERASFHVVKPGTCTQPGTTFQHREDDMRRLTTYDYEARLELAEMRIEDTTADVVHVLRYCFPECNLDELERMADHHPDVLRERRSCRRWAAYCRRRIRVLQSAR